ncbi:MAG TPA: hypothetical protein VGH49_03630 [Xanthobacteraceae bacterium]
MILAMTTRPLIEARHALGHAKIDADHFDIADYWLQAMSCESIAIPFFIARLRKRMRNSFNDEAGLVEAAGSWLGRAHQWEHAAMLELCDAAYELSKSDRRGARALLRKRLPRLMREHIICMDQVAVLVINTAMQGQAIPDPQS